MVEKHGECCEKKKKNSNKWKKEAPILYWNLSYKTFNLQK